jgi:class 3 adenylate cyclase
MSRLRDWLSACGLEHYSELLAEQRIDFDVLADLTEQDLERLQVPLGDRKRLLRAISTLALGAEAGSITEATIPDGLERRPVTVLFIDLTDYTVLTREIGAEAMHRLIQRFHQAVSAVIQEHGGSIERYIGDAIMGVFGLPVAHSNDAERALRAADAVHALMPRLSKEAGRSISVHIGGALGQVVTDRRNASSGNFSTVGDTVNLAARLVGLAASGHTVISNPLRLAAASTVAVEPMGEVSVKGFDQPVRAWRVRGWLDRQDQRLRLPLIGREAELKQFEAACMSCLDSGGGQVMYLRGDAGIGKSRLIEELELHAARLGFLVHKSLVLNFGVARTMEAAAQLVNSLLECELDANERVRGEALRKAVDAGFIPQEHLV